MMPLTALWLQAFATHQCGAPAAIRAAVGRISSCFTQLGGVSDRMGFECRPYDHVMMVQRPFGPQRRHLTRKRSSSAFKASSPIFLLPPML
jgi:hypothetical protein